MQSYTESFIESMVPQLRQNPNIKIASEIQQWVAKGNKFTFPDLVLLIGDLLRGKHDNQILEILEWLAQAYNNRIPSWLHSMRIIMLDRLCGLEYAENYFHSLSEENKCFEVCAALLIAYFHRVQTEAATHLFEIMKKKGSFDHCWAFNDMMRLHAKNGQYDKVLEIFNEMKRFGVRPDARSYWRIINSFCELSDVRGLERTLNEMEKDAVIVKDGHLYVAVARSLIKAGFNDKANVALVKAEGLLDYKNPHYNKFILLHAQLLNRDHVFRLCYLKKSACGRLCNTDYAMMYKSLMTLGEVEQSKELLKEWELSSGHKIDDEVIRQAAESAGGHTHDHLDDTEEVVKLLRSVNIS